MNVRRILVYGVPRSFGGIGTLIENMAVCNNRAGRPLQFTFLVPQGSPYLLRFQEMEYETIPVPPLSRVWAYRRAVRQALRHKPYDAVWIHNTSKADMILPVAAKRSGAKIMTHSHGVSCEETGVKRIVIQAIEFFFRRKLFAMIDCPIACSEDSAAYFYKGYPHPERIRIIHNGIWAEQYRFCPDERKDVRSLLGLSDGEVAICSCGRLSAVKNNQLLIHVLAQLPERFRLFLIGKGAEEQMLRQLADACGVAERVTFLGFRSDVNVLLNGMDVYAMPSLHEGMPFSLIEAQANGLPCVVAENISRETALTDLVHFVPIEDAADWSACIMDLPQSVDRFAGGTAVMQAGYDTETGFKEFQEICLQLSE